MSHSFLILAAALNAIAALLHVGCIVFGAPWYRFFGAGEQMARWAEAGSWRPALITSGIALMLALWSAYALSGADALPRLPLLRTALTVITAVYLLRGLAGFAVATSGDGINTTFWWWSSAICLGLGLVHLIGLRQAWTGLS